VFYEIRLSTRENKFFEYDPPKDAKTKTDSAWGFPALSHV